MWTQHKDTIPYITRTDLSLSSKNTHHEFEALWLEIISPIEDKILIGVIYSHPKQKDKEFSQYLSNTLKNTKEQQKDNTNRRLQSEHAKI